MTSEQTQRMSEAEIDALIAELNHDADEHKAFFPSDKTYQRMRHGSVCAIQRLRTQLASAETDAESVRLLLDEARNDLTEARSQLAAAASRLRQGLIYWDGHPNPNPSILANRIQAALSRLSPSPKQGAGGGEG